MLHGAIAMASVTAALFFLRFWRTTRDRFFLFFAIAFFSEGIVRCFLGLANQPSESEPLFYVGRLFAFSVILFAIADKNRAKQLPKS